MFTVGSGITLILEDNLELLGRNNNTASLITINSGGTLIMNHGIKITGNRAPAINSGIGGGGLHVEGTFIMKGGEISNNNSYSGGGVSVGSSGTLTMTGGKIFNNNASGRSGRDGGGGVYVQGSFTMDNGEIFNNSVTSSVSANVYSGGGGGVLVNGTFTMNDGKINNNSASGGITLGGGVLVGGTFTMNGGEISYNSVSSRNGGGGGGIGFDNSQGRTLTINGGLISGNSSSSGSNGGGGVYIEVGRGNIFIKTGGIIYGYIDGDTNSNIVRNSSGNILQNRGHAIHVSDTYNSLYVSGKDSTSEPNDNLSFNGTVKPPIWSGNWDY